MFTGIVTRSCTVEKIEHKTGLRRLAVKLEGLMDGLERGASVAVDGVCLTATEMDFERELVFFDVMQESLEKTTLGELHEGDLVHVERSAVFGQEVGGHIVSGHVTGTATVTAIDRPENNFVLHLEVPESARDHIFDKGFVAIKGASLTVVDYKHSEGRFEIWLIPETLDVTTFSTLKAGDRVNFEVDPQTVAIVETVQRVMQRQQVHK